MMKTKIRKFLAFALTCAVLCGCGTGNIESTTSQSETTIATTTESTTTTPEVTVMTTTTKKEYSSDKKYIALTFDDGPNTYTTVQVLDLLEEYNITASFFLIGQNINTASAEVVKRAYDMGCEINSHSYTHSDMKTLTVEEITEEMDKTAELIRNITGENPKFFRPPYISVNSQLYDAVDIPFICGVGCDDWNNNVTVEQRVKVITEKCDDATIILLHDSYGNDKTVEALREIIPYYLENGYEFLTVSQLFESKNVVPSEEEHLIYSYASEKGYAK